ncbi:MAG TPA: 3-phosphoshikimate 1-carboxyvinyltransferase [Candidatus Binatia bacterium]
MEPVKRPLQGELTVPGDKSIGHRAVIFAAIANGASRIANLSGGEDNHSTIEAFKMLGVKISGDDRLLTIEGKGFEGLAAPKKSIDCGNSGTTMRLLSGILAGRPFVSTLDGDASLRRRPMKRIAEPLEKMGARIESSDGRAPLDIHGGALKGIRYATPVASAQVKSAILLAGLQADGVTTVEEPQQSRDHTEIMARALGAKLEARGNIVTVEGGRKLAPMDISVPGDLSSAAFFMAAAAIIPGSDVIIRGVGCNPTRAGVIDVLRRMGASIEMLDQKTAAGEPVADIRVRGATLKGVDIGPEMVARTIDEYPILAVAAALAQGVTGICGAKELRYKESDRIAVMTEQLRRLGVNVEERDDGMIIEGRGRLKGAAVRSAGDHRVAMSLAVAGLCADGGVEIDDTACADISFPGFFRMLERIAGA